MPGAAQRTAWVGEKRAEEDQLSQDRAFHTGWPQSGGGFGVVCREQTAPKWSYGQVAADSRGRGRGGSTRCCSPFRICNSCSVWSISIFTSSPGVNLITRGQYLPLPEMPREVPARMRLT